MKAGNWSIRICIFLNFIERGGYDLMNYNNYLRKIIYLEGGGLLSLNLKVNK